MEEVEAIIAVRDPRYRQLFALQFGMGEVDPFRRVATPLKSAP